MAKKQIILDDEAKKRIVEKSKLTTLEMFALDALIVSTLQPAEKKRLAYTLSRKGTPTDNKDSIDQLVSRWYRKLGVIYYIEDKEIELFGHARKRDNEGNVIQDGNVLRSKDETLEELNQLATETNDAKLKAELLMKIADLQNWKKEQQTEESEQIKYYLPLKCSQCQLYKTAKMTNISTK